ncbi:MAG: UDP-N-acetylmuramate dehydrogenase [Dongiaceae bacterium]
MMAARRIDMTPLIERLPPVRGRLTENAPLAGITWFRVGGTAEVMFRPADREDLLAFLAGLPADVPVIAIGVGSNLLVRDGGVPGVVLRLGRGFAGIDATGTRVTAGAAALDINVATQAAEAGIAGLEFLSGVPGTIGGGMRMNAGAYGTELGDRLIEGEIVDGHGTLRRLTRDEFGFGYRHCALSADTIFLSATLEGSLGGSLGGSAGDPAAIRARMAEIRNAREASQPIRTRTGGSTFANPRDGSGRKAWELIDAAGCRGLRVGGAQVSELHCNFLVNSGTATAADLEALGEEVRRRVRAQAGIELEWEIRRIGVPAAGHSAEGRIA